jgi:hypothetical protein
MIMCYVFIGSETIVYMYMDSLNYLACTVLTVQRAGAISAVTTRPSDTEREIASLLRPLAHATPDLHSWLHKIKYDSSTGSDIHHFHQVSVYQRGVIKSTS